MLIELNEEERDFLQRICARMKLGLFKGQSYVTNKLDYDAGKLDVLREKLRRKPDNDDDSIS